MRLRDDVGEPERSLLRRGLRLLGLLVGLLAGRGLLAGLLGVRGRVDGLWGRVLDLAPPPVLESERVHGVQSPVVLVAPAEDDERFLLLFGIIIQSDRLGGDDGDVLVAFAGVHLLDGVELSLDRGGVFTFLLLALLALLLRLLLLLLLGVSGAVGGVVGGVLGVFGVVGRGVVGVLGVVGILLLLADAARVLGGRLLGLGFLLLSRLGLLLVLASLGEELPHRLGHVPILGHARDVDVVLGLVPLVQLVEGVAGHRASRAEVRGPGLGLRFGFSPEPGRGHEATLGDGLDLDVILGVVPPREIVEGETADGLDAELGRDGLLGTDGLGVLGVLGVLGLIIIRGFLLERVHPVSLLRGFLGRLEARFAGALPLGVDAVEHGHLVDVFEVVAVVPDAVSSVEVRLVVARVEGVARGRELRYPRVGWRREVAEHHPLLAAEAREHGRVRGGVAAVDEAAVE